MSEPKRRLRACVENWPEAETGEYSPSCCRFPKSCAAQVYDEERVREEDLESVRSVPDLRTGVEGVLRANADLRAQLERVRAIVEGRTGEITTVDVVQRVRAVLYAPPSAGIPEALPGGTPMNNTQGWLVQLMGDAALDTTGCPAIEIVHDGVAVEPVDVDIVPPLRVPPPIRVSTRYHSVGEAGELYFHNQPLNRTSSAVLVLAPGTWASVVPLPSED